MIAVKECSTRNLNKTDTPDETDLADLTGMRGRCQAQPLQGQGKPEYREWILQIGILGWSPGECC
jgi:hypothetical protein